MRIEWLYEARCELEELLAGCRAGEGEEAARALAEEILGEVEKLSLAPRMGVRRRETLLGRHGFRALLIGAYACIYRVEEDAVRIYHLTDAGKDDLYEILGVASRATEREVRAMRNNVFLKSTLRQPVKAAMLLLVTALITFTFVSRVSEYLLVREETERLAGFYRAAGALAPLGDFAGDAGEAVRYLEADPSVKLVDTIETVSGVVEGRLSGGYGRPAVALDNGTQEVELYPDYKRDDAFFYGKLTAVDRKPGSQGDEYIFYFTVDEVLAGHHLLAAGENERVGLANPNEWTTWGWKKDMEQLTISTYVDLTELAGELEVGGRYLLRGEAAVTSDSRCCDRIPYQHGPILRFKPLTEDGLWYYPVPEDGADFSDPALAGVEEEIGLYRDNTGAVAVHLVEDMSLMTSTWWKNAETYLVEGRWLNGQDDASGNKVCVVWENMGLHAGDKVTIDLRDLDYPYNGGLLYRASDLARLGEIETSGPVEYEVVGVINATKREYALYLWDFFLPHSAKPDTFTHGDLPVRAHEVLFELTGPDAATAFIAAAREPLGQLGVQAALPETGWADFQAAAQPMRRSSLYNALIFTGVLLSAVCLIVFLYFRMRRKDVAIARAMGVPVGRCVWDVSVPLLLIGLLGIGAGGGLGWRYTLDNAGETLAALSEFGGETAAALPGFWLAALWGAVLALLAAVTLGGALALSRRPVLELVQGESGARVRARRKQAAAEAEAAAVPVPEVDLGALRRAPAAVPAGGGGLAAGHVLRFVWRHVARSRLKTALSIVLAAGFTAALAAIQISIVKNTEQIDWLYENTTMEAEIVPMVSTFGGFIHEKTLAAIFDTGYITDAYVEASTVGAVVPYQGEWQPNVSLTVSTEDQTRLNVLTFEDEERFRSIVGSGAAVTITYCEGWDGSLFSKDWGEEDGETLRPVVLPKKVWDKYGVEPGGVIGLVCKGFRLCEVAGYYEGSTTGLAEAPALIPTSVLRETAGSRHIAYSKVHVTLDPARNREMDQFAAAILNIADSQGRGVLDLQLRAVIWDEELRNAVAPLENSIELMRVLYPVTLALSLLVAAGIAALFVMTSAKEAAILRVLGTTRLRSRVMLALQTAFTSLAGLLTGLLGVLAYAGRTRPELLFSLTGASALCALLYLLAAIAGAAVSAAAVTARNPLELLQVKE